MSEEDQLHMARYLKENFPQASPQELKYFTTHFMKAFNSKHYFPLNLEYWLLPVPKNDSFNYIQKYTDMIMKHLDDEERSALETFIILKITKGELGRAIIELTRKYGNLSNEQLKILLEKEYNIKVE